MQDKQIKGATDAANTHDTGTNCLNSNYSTEGKNAQVYTAKEYEEMRDRADVIHSAIFDLESARRTILPYEPHTAAEIESIEAGLQRELAHLDTILDRYQHLLDTQDKDWFDHR